MVLPGFTRLGLAQVRWDLLYGMTERTKAFFFLEDLLVFMCIVPTEARIRGWILPRAEITGNYELSQGSWEPNLGSLPEYPVLFTAELFLL